MDALNSEEDAGPDLRLSTAQRLALLERDTRSHARSLTAIIATLGAGFTEQQMAQLHNVVREELSDLGVRLDSPDHVDDFREDVRFLRRMRQSWDNASKKTGNALLFGLFGIVASIIGLGFWAWIKRGQG